MPGGPNSLDAMDRGSAAAYVASLSAELALLSRRHGLDTLGYLLDMAKLEAESHTGPSGQKARSLSAS